MNIFKFKRRKIKSASEGEIPDSEAASVLSPLTEPVRKEDDVLFLRPEPNPVKDDVVFLRPEPTLAKDEVGHQQPEPNRAKEVVEALRPEPTRAKDEVEHQLPEPAKEDDKVALLMEERRRRLFDMFHSGAKEEAEAVKVVTTMEKPKAKGIGSFFSIDIHDVFRYNPQYRGRRAFRNGRQSEYFDLELNPLELACFNRLEIIRHDGRLYDLVFRSRRREIDENLLKLMEFCIENYGLDFMNKGSFSPNDWRDMRLGAFSRFWIERARIENNNFYFNITLYNINANENINQF